MAYRSSVFPAEPFRTLVIEADSEPELEEAGKKALERGWEAYAQGKVPNSLLPAAWFIKRASVAPAARPPAGAS